MSFGVMKGLFFIFLLLDSAPILLYYFFRNFCILLVELGSFLRSLESGSYQRIKEIITPKKKRNH